MKFKKLISSINDEGEDIATFEIEGGENSNSIGSEVWFSNDGKIMEISHHVDDSILEEVESLFSNSNSRSAFRGAWKIIKQ